MIRQFLCSNILQMGPIKSDPKKWLITLNSDHIKRCPLLLTKRCFLRETENNFLISAFQLRTNWMTCKFWLRSSTKTYWEDSASILTTSKSNLFWPEFSSRRMSIRRFPSLKWKKIGSKKKLEMLKKLSGEI